MLSLALLLVFVPTAWQVTPASAAPVAYSADGISISASPAKLRPNKGGTFTLAVKDQNTSKASFASYYLYDVPADWTVLDNGTALAPSSPDPLIYTVPAADLQTNKIQLKPPANYLGSLTVSLGRQMGSPNLIKDFDGGSFDYVGQSTPSLPAANTQYAYHDPTMLYSNGTTCQSAQYGPCDGQYSIWPTANINGPAAQHLNNHWADLRSNTYTMPTTPANYQYSTSNVCANWNTAGPGGSNWSQNFVGIDANTASQYGKIAIFNGSTTMASPNNLLTTTVTGLNPGQPYLAVMNVANLSDDKANTLLPQTALYVQQASNQTGTVIGTTQPLANQSGCTNDQANWSVDTGIAPASDAGSLTISARNYVKGGNGNDIAIDGLSLYPMAVVALDLGVSLDNPSLTVSKTSSPASGSSVTAGQTVTYTVTANNSGDTPLDNVTLTDDLSGVLAKATLSGTPTASVSPAPTISGNTLTWTGSLDVGASVTLTYKVKINAGVTKADTMTNKVIGQATDGNDGQTPAATNCATGTEPGCFSTLTGAASGVSVAKTSDPPTGSTVVPGQTVTYTVMATNIGDVTFTDATLSDDMSDVLDDATLTGTPSSDLGAQPTFDAATNNLNWTGDLAPGQTVHVTYQVVVNADAVAPAELRNTVVANVTNPAPPDDPTNHGDPPANNCAEGSTDPVCSPVLPVGSRHLHVDKTSVPPKGSMVTPGQVVTYTLTAQNDGDVVYDNAELTDDLAGVFPYATLVDGPTSTSTPAPSVSGNTLSWKGSVPVGQTVTVTYSVKVNQDAPVGTHIINTVTGGDCAPCVHDVEVGDASLNVVKTSDPPSGGTVTPGQTVTYTVKGTNTGKVPLDPVTLTDDLSGVLQHSALVPDSLVTVTGYPVAALVSGSTVTWSGSLQPGQVVTITYQVVVDSDAVKGQSLGNLVVATAVDPANPDVPPGNTCSTGAEPGCSTVHPVGNASYKITKTSDPASGSEVTQGQIITYTLTDQNTGDVALTAASLTDDLSGVLNNADFVDGSLVASAGAQPVLDGTWVKWAGDLPVGQTVTVTYQVKVKDDATIGDHLVNSVKGSATNPDNPNTPPDGPCLTGHEPGCVTDNTVTRVGLDITKTSDPPSGTWVAADQVVSYTLTAKNAGEITLDSAELSDDMSGVLNNATLVAGSLTTTSGALPVVSGTTLKWTGSLDAGQTVIVTYQVKVNSDVKKGGSLINKLTGRAPNPNVPGTDVPSTCVTGTEAQCSPVLPIGESDWHLTKVSDPVTGSEVSAGQIVTYKVTAINDGDFDLNPAVVTDDLSNVLQHASLAGTMTASRGDAPKVSGSTLTWTGPLAVGQSVVLTYQVQIASVITPQDTLVNHVVGTAKNPHVPGVDVPGICKDDASCTSTLHGDPPAAKPVAITVQTGGVAAPGAGPQLALMGMVVACLAGAMLLLRRLRVGG